MVLSARRADRRRRKKGFRWSDQELELHEILGVYEDFEQAEPLTDEAEIAIYLDLYAPEEYIEPKIRQVNPHKWDGYNRAHERHHNHWTKAVEVAKIRRERKMLAKWKREI